ncbi:MAG: D-glycero-beta-D-manno-heptose-7-phosphate kinase [Ignavibacteriales bacterium]
MINFTEKRLTELKNNFFNKKIAVIGDLMLDGYFWGDVKRISPEAPVPVVEIDNQFFRFGGSANVVLNIRKLGAIPFPFGVVGNDNEKEILNGLFNENNIDKLDGIIIDESRPTTVKIRVIAANQHLVRIDKESKKNIDESIQQKLITEFKKIADGIDAVILEDYNKGVLTKEVIEEIISIAKAKNKLITVDPKFDNFFEYKNVDVFKPNKKEIEDAFGKKFPTEKDIENAGHELINKMNVKNVLITLGNKGAALINDGKTMVVPTKARKVADVSGAGDTVISTLTVALTAGAEILEAAYLANYAGGLVCEEVGIVPINIDQLFNEVREDLK